jgi:hypothetical protein
MLCQGRGFAQGAFRTYVRTSRGFDADWASDRLLNWKQRSSRFKLELAFFLLLLTSFVLIPQSSHEIYFLKKL